MSSSQEIAYQPDEVFPPGDTLLEVLDSHGLSQSDLAVRMGRPKKTINEIVKGKTAITSETALQLERVLGVSAAFWSNLQANYDHHRAVQAETSRLEQWVDWPKQFPYSQLAKLGWVRQTREKVARVRELLSFFGVASPEQWNQLAESQVATFRKSAAFEADAAAITAWLRQGERQAAVIRCEPYDSTAFRSCLMEARKLTIAEPTVFLPALEKLCASSGVAVVFVPQVAKCRASGATRWLEKDKALVQLSLRYRSNDHLWFTFFHEAGHVLLHPKKKAVFIETTKAGSDGVEEDEANRFAADFLIPPSTYAQFVDTPRRFTKAAIRSFARQTGVAPGIVVGRLQHDGRLARNHCNDLKVRYEWTSEE